MGGQGEAEESWRVPLTRVAGGPARAGGVGAVPAVFVMHCPWSEEESLVVPEGGGVLLAASAPPARDVVLACLEGLPQAEAELLWEEYERQRRFMREGMVDSLVVLRDPQLTADTQLAAVRADARDCSAITLVAGDGTPQLIALYPWGDAPARMIGAEELGSDEQGERMSPALPASALLAWYYGWDTAADGDPKLREGGPFEVPWPDMLEVVGPQGKGARRWLRVRAEEPLRVPDSLWEYAASAADQLMRWHAHGVPGRMEEPRHTRAVVLLAAAITEQARSAHTDVAPAKAVLAVELGAADRVIEHYGAPALQVCPAVPGVGQEERDALLAVYGTTEYTSVESHVRAALTAHLADADDPHVTIAGRREAMISRRH
ncbi:hypothetical protein [Streptomyces candidus]|uniref:Uncharacterized protein n=1 Tax=Streptomyces candidus TaxID=67283 RepID=A0A7X0HMZ9_9ACTN|nr:hypothetical protein [Streptomyces candidus]MBB6439133.1 hypothetical protein [Streptomyces candidus]GHH57548.1 hypothetical protein GCM10018773_65020 [Streptomyces candidus]